MKTAGKLLVLYITPAAGRLCERLQRLLAGRVTVRRIGSGGIGTAFGDMGRYSGVIAVMAAGIVVRGIAPFLKDKASDPAVVVIDEKGRYVISLLSGHQGGANALAAEIAAAIGAAPVITTATDVNDLPAPDVYAREQGYAISDKKLYARLAMAMLAGERIGVFVGDGEPDAFFRHAAFKRFTSVARFLAFDGKKLAVTWRDLSFSGDACCDSILYFIPRRLALGLGFHRDMTASAMASFVEDALLAHGLQPAAVRVIGTIDRRRGVPAFATLCRKLKAAPAYFSAAEIGGVPALAQNPAVSKYHAVGNVSEACALLASRSGRIVVPKQKGGTVTLCVALDTST